MGLAAMMDEADIVALFRASESERMERKAAATDRDRIRRTIAAMANDLGNSRRPGVIFIGQNDDLGCADLPLTDELMRSLAEMRTDGKILPFPSMTVDRMTVDGCPVAVVLVAPHNNPPVRFDGRIFVRVGPTTRLAHESDERILVEKRQWSILPADAQAVAGAVRDDFDLARFTAEYLPAAVGPEAVAENHRDPALQMRALRLLDRDGRPTMLGVLLLCPDPTRFLPGAYVQALRIAGTALSEPIRDQHRIGGTLSDQLRRLDELVDLWVETPTRIGDRARDDRPSFPPAALRQYLRNALLHRTYDGSNAPVRLTWYDDRVEIVSPGGPFGAITPTSFGQPGVTDYRNPNVAEALRNLGFVERFGVGLAIAHDALARNGNPAPDFDVSASHVQVTVRIRP